MRALNITYPIENGVITRWDDMEEIWKYTFERKLGIAMDSHGSVTPDNLRIMLTEAPLNPKENRKKMAEIMFEKFHFGGLQCKPQAMLTLYSRGSSTGVVVDSGDGVTHVMCVYDGYVLDHLTRRLNIAGRHVTRHLLGLLQQRGYALNATADFEVVREVKEKLCYVAYNYEKEMRLADETTVLMSTYELPDGRSIKLGSERFEATEALFKPELMGLECMGLSEMVFDSIQKAAIDLRPTVRMMIGFKMQFYKNILLSGGTSMFPGLSSRLEKDIREAYCSTILKGKTNHISKSINVIVDVLESV